MQHADPASPYFDRRNALERTGLRQDGVPNLRQLAQRESGLHLGIELRLDLVELARRQLRNQRLADGFVVSVCGERKTS